MTGVRARVIVKQVADFGFTLAESGRQSGVPSPAVEKALSRRDTKES